MPRSGRALRGDLATEGAGRNFDNLSRKGAEAQRHEEEKVQRGKGTRAQSEKVKRRYPRHKSHGVKRG